LKNLFKLVDKSIKITYGITLLSFGLYSICCVLFKSRNEINWFEYAGAFLMALGAIGLAGMLFTKLKNIKADSK
jgi:CHASE2 domain-containing sensor protein